MHDATILTDADEIDTGMVILHPETDERVMVVDTMAVADGIVLAVADPETHVFRDLISASPGADIERAPTRFEMAHSDLYGYLDSTAGDMNSLANAIGAADEAGFDVHAADDRRATAEACHQQAFEEMDQDLDAIDAGAVHRKCESARQALRDLDQGLDDRAAAFTLPDHVDSGVYDTLGDFAEYVYRESISIEQQAEEFADAA